MLSPFNIIAKPAGPLCNLDCTYCYYLEKERLFNDKGVIAMDDNTLETFTRKYIHEQAGSEITFVWQGGEPALAGIGFYKKALALQKKYGSGKHIHNSFQTNGLLLNDEWCSLFRDNNFLVGISVDGPEDIHDRYRLNKGGSGSFRKVMKAIDLLKKHGVEFNTLTVVNDVNAEEPLKVYRFLKEAGSGFMQFIPVVEKISMQRQAGGLSFVLPENGKEASITPWSVQALKFGRFIVSIFNEWVKKDVGRYFIQLFDATLANETGQPAGICVYSDSCGSSLAMEHNGDLFSCDHYVFPEYKTGNIHQSSISNVLRQPAHLQFLSKKTAQLPGQCRTCSVYSYCYGECPKNRFLSTSAGEQGLNYLCDGYRHFFTHVKPYMKYMAHELAHQRSPASVMAIKPEVILKKFGKDR